MQAVKPLKLLNDGTKQVAPLLKEVKLHYTKRGYTNLFLESTHFAMC